MSSLIEQAHAEKDAKLTECRNRAAEVEDAHNREAMTKLLKNMGQREQQRKKEQLTEQMDQELFEAAETIKAKYGRSSSFSSPVPDADPVERRKQKTMGQFVDSLLK